MEVSGFFKVLINLDGIIKLSEKEVLAEEDSERCCLYKVW